MSRLLIHVQYLKGIGHLRRIGLVAEAAAARGLEVHVASGGLPLPGFDPDGASIHQLPALQAGPGGFTDLRDARGHPIDDGWRAYRRDQLLALFDALTPDLLLIESFPFGRRALSFELMPLLERAGDRSPRPAIVCSVRDILQAARKHGRAEETVSCLESHFDAVLVHGDRNFAALEESFALAAEIGGLLHYTGFVAPAANAYEPRLDTPRGEVVVSMGGGAIGPALLDAALEARPMTVLADAPWRLISGPNLLDEAFGRLCQRAGSGVEVERFRRDFPRLLAAARLSISYAGYNTVCDLMRARVPAVLATYGGETGGETEQAARAARLHQLGLGTVLSGHDVTPERLAQAIEAALAQPALAAISFDLGGAERSAALLAGWAEKVTSARSA